MDPTSNGASDKPASNGHVSPGDLLAVAFNEEGDAKDGCSERELEIAQLRDELAKAKQHITKSRLVHRELVNSLNVSIDAKKAELREAKRDMKMAHSAMAKVNNSLGGARFWQNEFAARLQGLKPTFPEEDDLVKCPVCMDTLWNPYLLRPCGHVFCGQCLFKWFDQEQEKYTCPCCRTRVIGVPIIDITLRDAMSKMAKGIEANTSPLEADVEDWSRLLLAKLGIIREQRETPSGVYKYFKACFPTAKSTPSFLLYDDNCHVTKHMEVIGCQHFKDTAFPVDVFHFKSKHTDKDLHCELNCNPVAFSELHDDEDNWRFNSSICEQTNVWINGFQSILSDMEVTRYNFYLDEMVKRHNRFVIAELQRKGLNPRRVTLASLDM